MSIADFSAKERQRFRKLLEVAYSTNFTGEREAALNAAGRLAEAHGMTLREAAGMKERAGAPRARSRSTRRAATRVSPPISAPPARRPWAAGGACRAAHSLCSETSRPRADGSRPRIAAEKRRRDEALADAFRRGLDAEERAAEARRARQAARTRAAMRSGSARRRRRLALAARVHPRAADGNRHERKGYRRRRRRHGLRCLPGKTADAAGGLAAAGAENKCTRYIMETAVRFASQFDKCTWYNYFCSTGAAVSEIERPRRITAGNPTKQKAAGGPQL